MSKARTKTETQQPGQAHGEIGKAMGIDRKLRHVVRSTLADHAFDGRVGLPLIEQDRLVVEDAPADRGHACTCRSTRCGGTDRPWPLEGTILYGRGDDAPMAPGIRLG